MQSHSVASQNHIILQFIAILWTKIDSSIACRLNVFKSNWFRIEQKCFNLPIVWLRLSRYSNTKNKCYSHIFYLPKRFFFHVTVFYKIEMLIFGLVLLCSVWIGKICKTCKRSAKWTIFFWFESLCWLKFSLKNPRNSMHSFDRNFFSIVFMLRKHSMCRIDWLEPWKLRPYMEWLIEEYFSCSKG